jgi:sugar (pentulose or hexulose) kinase
MTVGDNVALGIDVGTTRIKAEVVALDAAELHCEAALTPWRQVADGPQADLDEIADVAVAVATAAADWAEVRGHKVVAIGVTGMAETGALLDSRSRPLAPAFAWHHTLGDPGRVQEALGRQHFILTTGRDCSISPSIIKLDMLRQRGHRFTRGQRWLNIPDYVAWRLCGVQAAEISTSSRTGLVDIAAGTWWDEALEFLGAGRWLLPGELVPGGTLLGRTLPSLPASLQHAKVATGGHDHPVGALAAGDSTPGFMGLSLGTAEAQVRIITSNLHPEAMIKVVQGGGTVDWHPLGDRWTVLGALPTGITLARLATLLGCETVADRIALSRAALDGPDPGPDPDPDRQGLHLDNVTFDSFDLRGISDEISRPALWRRAVEELVEESGALMARMEAVLGPYASAAVFGGWLNDPLVSQVRSVQLGPDVAIAKLLEPGAVGAALLAAWAAGEIAGPPGWSQS